MDPHELAWAAGFFDGEGWANRSGRGVQARINQAGLDGMPEVLIKFQRIVDVGRVQGPDITTGRQPLYRWQATSRADVAHVAEQIGPWLGRIKRRQFERALGERVVPRTRRLPRTEALAWVGGLYDGEGTACLSAHRTHLGHFSPEVSITQSGTELPEVLQRARSIIGCGRIYGPYEQTDSPLPVYRWKALAHDDVNRAIYQLLPWIGDVKRQQARELMRVLVEQGRLPRGNPAWGNRKTHCVRGHEYATARIRPYRSRGKGLPPRDSVQCLVCARDQARARRRRGTTC